MKGEAAKAFFEGKKKKQYSDAEPYSHSGVSITLLMVLQPARVQWRGGLQAPCSQQSRQMKGSAAALSNGSPHIECMSD